jgi:hypothetical protein
LPEQESLPNTLLRLSTEECGDKDEKNRLYKLALQNFDNILCYAKDKYHAYPLTAG